LNEVLTAIHRVRPHRNVLVVVGDPAKVPRVSGRQSAVHIKTWNLLESSRPPGRLPHADGSAEITNEYDLIILHLASVDFRNVNITPFQLLGEIARLLAYDGRVIVLQSFYRPDEKEFVPLHRAMDFLPYFSPATLPRGVAWRHVFFRKGDLPFSVVHGWVSEKLWKNPGYNRKIEQFKTQSIARGDIHTVSVFRLNDYGPAADELAMQEIQVAFHVRTVIANETMKSRRFEVTVALGSGGNDRRDRMVDAAAKWCVRLAGTMGSHITDPCTKSLANTLNFYMKIANDIHAQRACRELRMMVVAHPDDEALFGAPTLVGDGTMGDDDKGGACWTVFSMTDGARDVKGSPTPWRWAEFQTSMQRLGATGIAFPFKDCLECVPFEIEGILPIRAEDVLIFVLQAFRLYAPKRDGISLGLTRIVTHNPLGEYGHPQHAALHHLIVAVLKESSNDAHKRPSSSSSSSSFTPPSLFVFQPHIIKRLARGEMRSCNREDIAFQHRHLSFLMTYASQIDIWSTIVKKFEVNVSSGLGVAGNAIAGEEESEPPGLEFTGRFETVPFHGESTFDYERAAVGCSIGANLQSFQELNVFCRGFWLARRFQFHEDAFARSLLTEG
jgi:LmbE family N-acetylglucosaminyl deacetylase